MQSLYYLKKLREGKRRYIFIQSSVFTTYLPFPMFFISFSGCELPSGVISFQPKGPHLVYLIRLKKIFHSLSRNVFMLPSFMSNAIARYRNSW